MYTYRLLGEWGASSGGFEGYFFTLGQVDVGDSLLLHVSQNDDF